MNQLRQQIEAQNIIIAQLSQHQLVVSSSPSPSSDDIGQPQIVHHHQSSSPLHPHSFTSSLMTTPIPTRRRMLRRLAGGLVTGLTLSGASLAISTTGEAQARTVVGASSQVGSISVPTGGSLPTGNPGMAAGSNAPAKYGILATDGSPLNLSDITVLPPILRNYAAGVFGYSKTINGNGVAGVGQGDGGIGVSGFASGPTQSYGVYGSADSPNVAYGVYANATSMSVAYGVYATAGGANNSYGILAAAGGPNNVAGQFNGSVSVSGNLTKTSGSFKIDHPLDPANQYLYHSFVESPDMMNIYNGLVTLDSQGTATVALPTWFEALNADYRYQLTPLGEGSPDLHIAQEVKSGEFKIAGGKPGQRVSWQLTGIRQDEWAKAHRIPVEEVKPDGERGLYIHPELFGQPADKKVHKAPEPPTHN